MWVNLGVFNWCFPTAGTLLWNQEPLQEVGAFFNHSNHRLNVNLDTVSLLKNDMDMVSIWIQRREDTTSEQTTQCKPSMAFCLACEVMQCPNTGNRYDNISYMLMLTVSSTESRRKFGKSACIKCSHHQNSGFVSSVVSLVFTFILPTCDNRWKKK